MIMRQLGSCSQASNLEIEEENFTVVLDYDWQTQRVMVQLKFIYEGCYHATIKYKGTELHNGDFDIIVLNSKLNKMFQVTTHQLFGFLLWF